MIDACYLFYIQPGIYFNPRLLIYLSPFFSSGNATNFLKKLGHIPHLADGFLGVLLKKMSFHCQEFPVNWELDQMWAYSGKRSSLGSAGSLASINNKLSHVVCPGLDALVRKFPINLSLTGLSKAIFIYLQLSWVFIPARATFQLLCMGLSKWLLLLWFLGSRTQAQQLWCPQAELLCNMWDLPRPGIASVSPALVSGFFTTEPPGKPEIFGNQIKSGHSPNQTPVCCWWECKLVQPLWKTAWRLLKHLKIKLLYRIQPSHFLIYIQRKQNQCLKRYLHPCVHGSIIHHSQDTQTSLCQQMSG